MSAEDPAPLAPCDIRPGDVIRYPFGIHREMETVTVLGVHRYDNGGLSIRYRFTSNPRGINWGGYVAPDDPEIRLVSRVPSLTH